MTGEQRRGTGPDGAAVGEGRHAPPSGWYLRVWVWLVAAHSLAVGLGLLVAPDLATTFAGFGPVAPRFFARQAGVFHLALAAGYLLEIRRGGVALLVGAKTLAFAFLMGSWLAGAQAWSLPLVALGDGAMGLVAWWLWRRAGR